MMATVPHVTSGLGIGKFQADGFLLTRVYNVSQETHLFRQDYLLHRDRLDEPPMIGLSYFNHSLYNAQGKLSYTMNAVHQS